MKAAAKSDTLGLYFFVGAMFLVGLQMAETGAALEKMTLSLHLSGSQQGTLVSLRFVGGLVVGLLLWRSQRWVPMKLALSVALLCVLGSGFLLLNPTYPSLILLSLLRGISTGAIIPLSGIYASTQRARHPGVVASAVNASVSAGLVVMAGGAMLLASNPTFGWQVYLVPAIPIALFLLLSLTSVKMPSVERGADPKTTIWPLAVSGFLIVGSEAILLGMIPALSVATGRFPLVGEGYALILMIGVLLGRTSGSMLFKKMGAPKVLSLSAVSISAFALLWSLLPVAAPIWVLMLGLSTANLFPGLITYVAERRPEAAAATVAATGWTGGLGGVALPIIAGVAAELGLPGRAFSLFLFVPVVAAVSWILSKR